MRLFQSGWITKCLFATVVLVSLAVATSNTHSQQAAPDYKNPRLPVDQRVADLLSRMTLEEKVAQLICLWANRPEAKPPGDFSTDRGDFSGEKAAQVMKYGMGQIARQRERKDARHCYPRLWRTGNDEAGKRGSTAASGG